MTDAQRAEVLRLNAQKVPQRKIAKDLGLSRAAVQRALDSAAPPSPAPFPDPAPEAGGPALPESIAKDRTEFRLDSPGWWLVLGDCHLPMHDRRTIEIAVEEARTKNAAGVLLNGDILDMFGITPFFREPDRSRFVDELDTGKKFLEWLRSRLPKARICWREGNHEFRLKRYIADRAQALYDLPSVQLPALVDMPKHGVEWVQDKRKVLLGKLITLHGHELRKGQGVNPARYVYLRTHATTLVSHFHRTSEHHERALDERQHATWSVGCACYLSPDYDPYGQANHGYALVELAADGWFSVHNRRVLNGRAV